MKSGELEIIENIKEGAPTAFFTLKGRLNTSSADDFQSTLEKALELGCKNIIVNMTLVDFLSSMGIRVILKTYKQVTEKGGKFGVERPSNCVKNVLGMAALKDMLVT